MFKRLGKSIIGIALVGAMICGTSLTASSATAPEYEGLPEPCYEMES